jgi:hypothetical protein
MLIAEQRVSALRSWLGAIAAKRLDRKSRRGAGCSPEPRICEVGREDFFDIDSPRTRVPRAGHLWFYLVANFE